MSKIPSGWEIIPLSEVIQTQKGKKPDGLGPKDDLRTVPYINIAAFETQKVGEFAPEQEIPRCEPNDTLLVWDGARAGLCGRGMSGYIGSTLARVTSDLADPAYLYYFIHSNYSTLNTQTKGVGIPHINPAVLNSLEFPLAPLAEQTRIVEKLEELFSDLDSGVAELKAAQKKLAQYRQSLLKAAVEGELTAEWRTKNKPKETGAQLLERILKERRARWEEKQLAKFKEQGKKPPKGWQDKYPEPVQPDIANLPVLPEGWVWASVEQISSDEPYSLAIGPFGSNLKVPDYRDLGVPLVFVRNIRSRIYGGTKTKYVTPEKAQELRAHSVQTGDVLITKMGEPPGDADVYPPDQPPAIITADCIKVRCWPDMMKAHFFAAVINSHIGKRQIEPITQGVAQKKVSLGRFSSLAVPVPPVAEQAEIVKLLVKAERETTSQDGAINHSIHQSAAQRKNILKAAFSGKLVPQDPEDEPASVLLDRIRAERAEREKQPKPRKAKKKKKEATAVAKKLLDVLKEAGGYIPAQEAFLRCGITDGSLTEQIEVLYAELRQLDKTQRLLVNSVADEQGRKLYDLLLLIPDFPRPKNLQKL